MKCLGEKLENQEYQERNVAHGLLFNNKGEIAVAYIEKHNMYNLIGGKIEEKEEPKEALIRETKEEIGYSLKNIEYMESIKYYYYLKLLNKYELAIMNFYKAEIDEKICNPIEEDHQLIWAKPEEIVNKMYFEYDKYILNTYIEQLENKNN